MNIPIHDPILPYLPNWFFILNNYIINDDKKIRILWFTLLIISLHILIIIFQFFTELRGNDGMAVTYIQQGKKLNFDNSKCWLMDCLSFIIFIYSGKWKNIFF